MAKPETLDEQPRYPDEITVNGGRTVRLSKVNPDTVLRIGRHKVRAGDIPQVAARLTCGHIVRGIAFQKDNVVFCEKDHERVFVAEVLN